MKQLADRIRSIWHWHVEKRMLPLVVRPEPFEPGTEVVGDLVLPRVDRTGAICYCVGVGEEIVLDTRLADVDRARVYSFDPTPRAVAFMAKEAPRHPGITFLPIGVWREDCTMRFHAPPDPRWVSHSITEDAGRGHFDAPCRSLRSIMRELGHDHIDLLKLNIEGAEHVVLDAMLADGIRPTTLVLTWEGKDAFSKAVKWTRRLRAEGYRYVARKDWFFTYVLTRGGEARAA